MPGSFGIPQITSYLTQMCLKLAHVDYERELVELAFHGSNGQWRMIVSIQQHGEARKLLLIAPHIGTVTAKRRLECLEALLAVNYRIAVGKFGIDLADGEVRLEEAIPLGTGIITFEQFQLAFGAIMQSVAMYHSLLPRIVYGNLTPLEALQACEEEFASQTDGEKRPQTEPLVDMSQEQQGPRAISLDDVLAEVTRIFEDNKE